MGTSARTRGGLPLGGAAEEAGDRPVLEDLLDGPGQQRGDRQDGQLVELAGRLDRQRVRDDDLADLAVLQPVDGRDRKSTRLNSSHANISYAVFCLKKKKSIAHHHIT